MKFRISGHKNTKREERIQLKVCQVQSEAIEEGLYSEVDSNISQWQANTELPWEENVCDEEQQECL